VWITTSLANAVTPTTVALGNFDGIHRGHRQVVRPILKPALIPESPPKINGGDGAVVMASNKKEVPYSTVVTFRPHPVEFFTGQAKKLLTPPEEKIALLESLGVEQVVFLRFDEGLAALTPVEFVEEILLRHLQARRISVGWDFRFGRKRSGTAKDLQAIAASYGIEVTVVPLYYCENGERIGSSSIRQFLLQGNVGRSNQLLGRPYSLIGRVIPGEKLGRTLGFPTANLELPPEKFLPRFGVYAVEVFLPKLTDSSTSLLGVMNIGCRPTVEGKAPTVEVHLFDWSGDLYGQTLTVQLKEFLRPEQKFASLDELKAQIQEDCAVAKKLLKV
jgi:riboflavin kinase/FMN adenylyltransferase